MHAHAGRAGHFVSPASHLSQDDTHRFVPTPGSSVFRNPLFSLTQIEIARYSPINSTTWKDRAETWMEEREAWPPGPNKCFERSPRELRTHRFSKCYWSFPPQPRRR